MQTNESYDVKDMEVEKLVKDKPIAVPVEGATTTTGKSTDLEAGLMPPPPDPRPLSAAASDKDEDEVLALQVLSARSSTPYIVEGNCCSSADVGASHSTTVSPVKQEPEKKMPDENTKQEELSMVDVKGVKYSRSDLMSIRDDMMPIPRPAYIGNLRFKHQHLAKCESEETSFVGTKPGNNKSKNYRTPNPPNDLMPSFFKRKAAGANGNSITITTNSITYDNFKYSDSNPFANHNDAPPSSNHHRRIGSGRLSNRDINWDYIPEEDPERDNLPEFFSVKDSSSRQSRHSKKHDLDDNSNYVKRVINSVVGECSYRSKNSTNSSIDERYSGNSSGTSSAQNKSEEPEWFSCGPSSRLDTIELCGFDESDQQKIRKEMEEDQRKTDANNNHEGPAVANSTNGGHKDKKNLAFQFDSFSTHASKPNNNSNSSSRMPSSKFLPLFNAKNRDGEKAVDQKVSHSVNDFFQRSDVSSVPKEKLSLPEIPSVEEIEAKWKIPHQPNESKGRTNNENLRTSTENFKKMLNQLNQQQNGAMPTASCAAQQQQQQPAMNLFNNENLSNFIKQRNLQQQLLQKQQQQAAIAQLQLNAILSRPDTQMLLLSLARGDISKHGLMVQLANPNLTPSDRDAISAVLTVSASGQYHQQLAINSNHQQQQQQQLIANQLQNLALLQQMNRSSAKRGAPANGMNNSAGSGGCSNNANGNMRTYSQEELQSHANYILHNAMMKKKLEEQTMQKILQLQTSMLGNAYNGNSSRGNESLAGPKNSQQQSQVQHNQHSRQRKSANTGGNCGNNVGRRRSTSSTSSNATVNTSQMKLASELEFHQLEQRRNSIATTTVGADEFLQVSQRI